jgi:hypothetical protein
MSKSRSGTHSESLSLSISALGQRLLDRLVPRDSSGDPNPASEESGSPSTAPEVGNNMRGVFVSWTGELVLSTIMAIKQGRG